MTSATPTRMQQLQQMLQKEPNDTFLLYGLALEFKKANDFSHALEYLDRVIGLDAGYCYAYHQKGMIHESAGNLDAAKAAYQQGITAAKKKGDQHAGQELEAALQMIE